MLKKLGIHFVILLMIAVLASCSGGSRVITFGDIEITENDMRGNYSSFTGNYFKNVKLEEGETLTVTFSVHTEKGKLTAEVLNTDGKKVAVVVPGDTLVIDDPGKYKLQAVGEKHKGNFTLSWEIE
jgi:major membrane immunogen (membrane-anchored lipoprotein)